MTGAFVSTGVGAGAAVVGASDGELVGAGGADCGGDSIGAVGVDSVGVGVDSLGVGVDSVGVPVGVSVQLVLSLGVGASPPDVEATAGAANPVTPTTAAAAATARPTRLFMSMSSSPGASRSESMVRRTQHTRPAQAVTQGGGGASGASSNGEATP